MATKAQTSAQQVLNAELRDLFRNLTPPVNGPKFFYDQSAHSVDSVFFGSYVTDTSNPYNWTQLYEEMFYAAYDTTQYQHIDDLLAQRQVHAANDTVQIATMDWSYNLLTRDALNTPNYFVFDTVNNLLYDLPNRPNSPYLWRNVFAGSTLELASTSLTTTFKLDPALFFRDHPNQYDLAERTLRIDFGDGTGWHIINPFQTTYYTATYSRRPSVAIKYGIFSGSVCRQYSLSLLSLRMARPQGTPPDIPITHIPGISGGIYTPSPSCNPNAEKKYLIYCEGLDLLNNESAGEIYDRVFHDNGLTQPSQLKQLKNLGYSIVIVNWDNPYLPIQDNAQSLIDLIEYLKQKDATFEGEVPQPFVVAGESMGGVICRYALCRMEQPNYSSPWPIAGGHVAHNTRLLITNDAPHQGANIPMAMQHFYKAIGTFVGLGIGPIGRAIAGDYVYLLNAPSAQQLLIEHVDTNPWIMTPIGTYSAHPMRHRLLDELAAMGNYPVHCKKVALTDGSWTGAHQQHLWDGSPRQVNDKILEMDASLVYRVLGIRIVGTEVKFEMRTNPQGYGRILFGGYGITHWKIKLRRWGVRLVFHTTYLLRLSKHATNLKPYCVMPGSNNSIGNPLAPEQPSGPFNFGIADVWGLSGNMANGQLHVQTNVPILFWANLNGSFNLYSDGFDFGYIPTASAFDYTGGKPLDHPLIQDPVQGIMSATPFDVVFTNTSPFNYIYRNGQAMPWHNSHHMRIWTDNLEKLDANGDSVYYETCEDLVSSGTPGASRLPKRLLAGEIGDDELYLENISADYQKAIEVERTLYLNHRNPYYNYPSVNSANPFYDKDNITSNTQNIVFSKENPALFNNNPNPTLLADKAGLDVALIMPPYMNYSGTYQWQPSGIVNCCEDYAYRPLPGPVLQNLEASQTAFLHAYPNPMNLAGTRRLELQYQTRAAGKALLQLTDLSGRVLVKQTLTPSGKVEQESLALPEGIGAGLYNLQILPEGEAPLTHRILIQQ